MRVLCDSCWLPRAIVCYGTYEVPDDHRYSCSECCGHGCEDGHCDEVTVGRAWKARRKYQAREALARRTRVARRNKRWVRKRRRRWQADVLIALVEMLGALDAR